MSSMKIEQSLLKFLEDSKTIKETLVADFDEIINSVNAMPSMKIEQSLLEFLEDSKVSLVQEFLEKLDNIHAQLV